MVIRRMRTGRPVDPRSPGHRHERRCPQGPARAQAGATHRDPVSYQPRPFRQASWKPRRAAPIRARSTWHPGTGTWPVRTYLQPGNELPVSPTRENWAVVDDYGPVFTRRRQRANGTDVEILNWLDDHSRYLLGCTVHRPVGEVGLPDLVGQVGLESAGDDRGRLERGSNADSPRPGSGPGAGRPRPGARRRRPRPRPPRPSTRTAVITNRARDAADDLDPGVAYVLRHLSPMSCNQTLPGHSCRGHSQFPRSGHALLDPHLE